MTEQFGFSDERLASEVARGRQKLRELIDQHLRLYSQGRHTVYSAPTGLGKTHAFLEASSKNVMEQQTDNLIITWASNEKVDDALRNGIQHVHIRDPLRDMPEGWRMGDPWQTWDGVPAMVYRGKGVEGMCAQTDKSTPCFGCPFYSECPHTYMMGLLLSKQIRIVLGTHALLTGQPAESLSNYLGQVAHVIVDEDNDQFITKCEFSTEDMVLFMVMVHWQAGANGLNTVIGVVSGVTGLPAAALLTARAQALALIDTLRRYEDDRTLDLEKWGYLLRNFFEPTCYDTEYSGNAAIESDTERYKWRFTQLRDLRLQYGDQDHLISPLNQKWRQSAYRLREFIEALRLMLTPGFNKKVMRVTAVKGSMPIQRQSVVEFAWFDPRQYFQGSNGKYADFHYFTATPDSFEMKHQLGGFIGQDGRDTYQQYDLSLSSLNAHVTMFGGVPLWNCKLTRAVKWIEKICDETLAKAKTSILLVMPDISLCKQYQAAFKHRPEIHVEYLQAMQGVNKYEHCNGIVIVGNNLPGQYGVPDAMTLTSGLPQMLRIEQTPALSLAPGAKKKGVQKTVEVAQFRGVSVQPAVDAKIIANMFQAAGRIRSVNKEEPGHIVFATNLDIEGYAAKRGINFGFPVEHRDIVELYRDHKTVSPTVNSERLRVLSALHGGVVLNPSWLMRIQPKKRNKKEQLFPNLYAADNFITWMRSGSDELNHWLQSFKLYSCPIKTGKLNGEIYDGYFDNQTAAQAVENEIQGHFRAQFEQDLQAARFDSNAAKERIKEIIGSAPKTVGLRNGQLKDRFKRSKGYKLMEPGELNALFERALWELQNNREIMNNNSYWLIS